MKITLFELISSINSLQNLNMLDDFEYYIPNLNEQQANSIKDLFTYFDNLFFVSFIYETDNTITIKIIKN